jgi:hypothetical protein
MIRTNRQKAELQTPIPNFRAASLISLNVVSNGVELRDGRADQPILFGFGKTESQERAPTLIYWRLTTDNCGRGYDPSYDCPADFNLLATDYRQLAADDKETAAIRQCLFILQSPVFSCQSPVFISSRPRPYSSTRSTFSPPPRRG